MQTPIPRQYIRYLVLFLFLTGAAALPEAEAQRIRYDDIYDELGSLTPEQAFFRLSRFQAQDPYFTNTYVQLGHISEVIYRNFDPLREVELVKHWARNAILYYQLVPVYLINNEVRRTREYFSNLPIEASGRRLNNEDLLDYIDERIRLTQEYRDSVVIVYEALERSKGHYNNCIRIFNEINAGYDHLKEVLLRTDPEFLYRIDILEQEFQACLKEFEAYRSLLEAFPILDYDQRYRLRPIETYRLEGLTNSDFLENQFVLWDFGGWVDAFRATFEGDIMALRKEIEQIQEMFDDNLNRLSWMRAAEPGLELPVHDELFLFRLGRYDNNSLVRELFTYLEERQRYILMTKDPLNAAADSASAMMNRRLRYYYRLALQANQGHEKLRNFQATISTARVRRFQDFFNHYYRGEQGLTGFFHDQQALINRAFDESLRNLRLALQEEAYERATAGSVTDRSGNPVPLRPVHETPEAPARTHYVTQGVHYMQHRIPYVSGILLRGGGATPFIARIDAEGGRTAWVTEVGERSAGADGTGLVAERLFGYDRGVLVIETRWELPADPQGAGSRETAYSNTLIHLDESGRLRSRTALEPSLFPVFLHHDDINQINLLAFGGLQDGRPGLFDRFIISQVDSAGYTEWQVGVDLRGSLVDIVKTGNSYLALFNFQEYRINGERVVSPQDGRGVGLCVVELSLSGRVLRAIPVVGEESFFIDRVFQISSDEISLVGYSGHPGSRSGDLKYLILTASGDVTFHNLK